MEQLKALIPQLEGKRVLIVGDLMLDEHIWSKVSRISPEAPVPVAEVKKISHVPGGSGNVALNIKTLSGIPILIGLIGNDSSGQKLTKSLKASKIPTNYIIKTNERPTILKSRIIAESQQVIRVDREDNQTISPQIEKRILGQVKKLIKSVDAVIISDYKKGTISNLISKTIIQLARKNKKPIAIDPKGNNYSKYQNATVITPNLKEAAASSGINIYTDLTLKSAGKLLLKNTNATNILITRGKDGMSLFSRDGKIEHIPVIPREVFDITGAGDTAIAALSLALASGSNMHNAAMLGNYAAGVAVSKVGTQPVFKDELEEALEEHNELFSKKIKSRSELAKIIKKLKRQNSKIIFTNGCFDILHLGHIRYLKEAKKLGEILIIGLNSDASVKKLKGYQRPYVGELERAEILASLEFVDYVTIFSEVRPDNLIKLIQPAVHVKGGDYKIKNLPEAQLVKRMGGKIKIIPPIKNRSTTNIIEKIKERMKI